jgi:MbtH protein
MANPFDDENGEFLVLINAYGEYSLWPAFKDVPIGWTLTGPPGGRQECLHYIDERWTEIDMRPRGTAWDRQAPRH